MRRIAVPFAALGALAVIAMFVAWGVAIWQPWGHGQEWKLTALLAFFIAVASIFAAVMVNDIGGRK